MKRCVGTFGLGLLLLGMLSACGEEKVVEESPQRPVVLVPVAVRDVEELVAATGQILAKQRADVAAQVGGEITQILVDEGATVAEDTLVIEIDREACQWILWYQIMARMYNGSGSLGRLDVLLYPYYQRDTMQGFFSDEEAVFHLACLLLRDTAYSQLGGPNAQGVDVTNPVSYLGPGSSPPLENPGKPGCQLGRGG